MSDIRFCRKCGEHLAAGSKFCEHCGERQREDEQRDDAGGASAGTGAGGAGASKIGVGGALARGADGAVERVEALAPGTTELATQLLTQLRTPAAATALIGGGLAALGTFAIGLLFGLILSDKSLMGSVDIGKGFIDAGFAQMLNFLQVGYSDGVGKLGPALFLIFPIGACAVAAATQAQRTLGLAPPVRLASGAGVGLAFGLLMLVPALATGGLGGGLSTAEPDLIGAVLLGMLWGAIGGLLGTWYMLRTSLTRGYLTAWLPARLREAGRTVYVALRPLALLLAVMTVLGTATWTVETLLKSDLRDGNSLPVATIDHAAYAIEHGLHWTELAGLAQFRLTGFAASSSGVPVPVGDVFKIKADSAGNYRLFGFGHAMPAYTFALLLIVLLGSALLLTLSAGFAVARLHQPTTPWVAAAWGCLVGPIWSLTMVILNALVAKDFFGRANGGSIFGTFLLGGLVLGALGGLVGLQAERRRAPVVGRAGMQ
jgi:hypothetical protein